MELFTAILIYIAGVATPYGKKLISKILKKAYNKADKEIDRWH